MKLYVNRQAEKEFINNPDVASRILYDEGGLRLIIDSGDKYLFHNEPKGWCLILGSINPIKKPAKRIFQNFFSKVKNFIEGFDGNYLVVIFDKNTREIHMTKDILGLMHAYYVLIDDKFCLSDSLVNVIQFLNKGNLEIDSSSLNLYLTFQYLPSPYTMFKNIYQMPLLSLMTLRGGILKQSMYETRVLKQDPHWNNSPKTIKKILISSLQKQLGGNKNGIGAFLSGGMDTSSTVAILASEFGIKPMVFTAGFNDKEYDETHYAQIVARCFDLRHEVVNVDENDIYSLPKIASLYENPIADRAVLAEYVICDKINRSKINFMISGEGGDEVLGFPRNLPDNIEFPDKLAKDNNALAKYYYSLTSLFPKDIRKKMITEKFKSKEDYLSKLYNKFGSVAPFEKILFGQWKTWLIDNVLMKDLRLFKHFGFEFVSPYIDKDLMDFVSALPVENKMDGLQNKNYLKSAMKGLLPIETLKRKKHRFHLPMETWFRGNMYDFICENLISKGSFATKYLNRTTVQKLLSDHKSGINDFNRPIWSLLFLEFWYRSFREKTLE